MKLFIYIFYCLCFVNEILMDILGGQLRSYSDLDLDVEEDIILLDYR